MLSEGNAYSNGNSFIRGEKPNTEPFYDNLRNGIQDRQDM
jgi:hypothetical protein